jgi:soluble lytic murein transglycosylase-like protein
VGNADLALDRGRYRATLRDVPRERFDVEALEALRANPSQSVLSFRGGRVALAIGDDASMTLNNAGRVSPSETFLYWLGKGTAIPQDIKVAQTRQAASNALADLTWLADANLPTVGECAAIDEVNLAADIHQLVLALRTPKAIQPAPVRSETYLEHIRREAKRFGLPPQLVFGIMRAESAFNPYAVSNAGALGLMQVVPDTAGNEVHRFLTGKSSPPSRTMFFDPVKNIEYGSAYLHLLSTRYFSGISNRSSRELCMIAAYNAGPGAVMRVFNTASRDEAVAAINATTPTHLFNRLSRQMPAEETRLYIGKVLAAINSYPG